MRVTPNVTMNFSILFAALGIDLAVATEQIAESPHTPPVMHMVANVFVFLTVIYAIGLMIWQIIAVLAEHEKAPEFFRSTFCGAFILLLAIVYIDHSTMNVWLLFFGFIFCIIAFIISVWNVEETTTVKSGGASRSLIPPYKLFLPEAEPAFTSVNIAILAPLLEKEQLYMFPQLRSNGSFRFFTEGKGTSVIENDDACSISSNETLFALCDGAPQSKYSHPWGTLLGNQWCDSPLLKTDAASLSKWLQSPQKEWQSWVKNTLKSRLNAYNKQIDNKQTDRPIMVSEEIVRLLGMGASTTFLGLSLDRRGRRWHATTLGNTCLFIFSNNQLSEYFPSQQASSPHSKSVLINSADSDIEQLATKFETTQGQIRQGDIFVMATQPLAQWIFPPTNGKRGNAEQKQREWEKRIRELLSLNTQDEFSNFVIQLRRSQNAPADDYSMVRITF